MSMRVMMLDLEPKQVICEENKANKEKRIRNVIVCKTCKREFYSTHPNQVRYKVCGKCYTEFKCKYCGKWYRTLNEGFCSHACRSKYEYENKIGMYSKEAMEKNHLRMINDGFFSSEKQRARSIIANKKMKEQKIGLYDPEFCKAVGDKGRTTQKELVINVYNKEFQSEMSKRSVKKRQEDPILKEKFHKIALDNLDYINANNLRWYDKEGSKRPWCNDPNVQNPFLNPEKRGFIGNIYCDICGMETFHVGNRCIECKPWEHSLGMKHCEKCNKETFHAGNRCSICNPWSSSNFTKEEINNAIEFLDYFTPENVIIENNSIVSLNGVPGVWAKFTEDDICLDVAETKDIGKEMKYSLKSFSLYKNKTDNELLGFSNSYYRIKYRNMWDLAMKHGKLIKFVLVAKNILSKSERWIIEAKYALDYNAKFWKNAPGQRRFE